MSLKCHIVRDLFPNYIEKLTSEETNQEIRKHLEECPQCRNEYGVINKPIPEIIQEELENNKQEVNYLKKYSKKMKRTFKVIGVLVFAIIVILAYGFYLFSGGPPANDKVTDIAHYSEYLGSKGKHSEEYLIKNDIFPDSIPESARVESFSYYYSELWDPNCVAYLVYTCNEAEYAAEVKRLSGLNSNRDYLIYGAKGFNYPVCAIYTAKSYGYVYALADEKNNRLIYVEITYCNFFSDIDYEKIIDKKYLPIDFDAKKGNATRKAFDAGEIRLNQ